MDAINAVFILGPLAIAMAVAFCAARVAGQHAEENRYASIDGLRGYLAIFVFLHHAAIWYFYVRTGQWVPPASNLFNHFGKTSVALFFMITGFLFFSKILYAKEKTIDWARLFISRVLRLTPLYLFTLTMMTLVVAVLSNFVLRGSPISLLKGLTYWLGFTVFGAPDLNGIQNTSLIVASVFWTLPYEWLFYFSLPLLALFLRRSVHVFYIALSTIGVLSAAFKTPSLMTLAPFLGGIVAALLARSPWLRQFAMRRIAALVVLASLIITVVFYRSVDQLVPLVLLSIVFAIIACGNTLFGLLTLSISKTLGQISYSIYLLHGLLLFIVFKFIIGFERAAVFSPLEHWLVISVCSAGLIMISCATFKWIEAPAMRSLPAVTAWVRSHMNLLGTKRNELKSPPVERL